MIAAALIFAYACFGLGLLMNLWRLALGPSTADRILALDTMVINAIAIVMLMGVDYGASIYFEASMLLAMVGFVSTVAFAKFVLRGDVIE
jgi:multicomponent K+:H+ antiporter subunit F